MANPATKFKHELEILRRDAEAAKQFFYVYLTIHDVASGRQDVYKFLNRSALFWNTVLAALQTSTFITLGRIFDTTSNHNIDHILNMARNNLSIFSKHSLGIRLQKGKNPPPDWIPKFLLDAYVPTNKDFLRLQANVDKYRITYDGAYKDIRNKIFAHTVITGSNAISAAFSNTTFHELQRLLVFPSTIYETLWQLFVNGRKPILSPQRYSMKQIRMSPSSTTSKSNINVQERITHETEQFLKKAAK